MNTLIQENNFLLGSQDSIKNLEQKDNARILVISDSHGASRILYNAIREKGPIVDALVLCGDSNDDLAYIIQKSAEDMYYGMCLPPVIAFVTGNNDSDSYPIINPEIFKNPHAKMYTELKSPLSQTFKAAGKKIFVIHGHRHSLYSGYEAIIQATKKNEAQICLFGHTHIAQSINLQDGITLLNPGSIARPRNCQPPTFAILNVSKEKETSWDFYKYTESGSEPYTPESNITSFL